MRQLPTDYIPQPTLLPSTSINLKNGEQNDVEMQDGDMDEDDYKNYQSPEQISYQLITLSLLPDSRWKNLVNLDIIRVSFVFVFFFTLIFKFFSL